MSACLTPPRSPRRCLLPLHARHLLQYRADRGGVVLAMAAPHRLGVDRHRGVEHGRRAAEPTREVADPRHILLPDRHFNAGPAVTAFPHHGCPKFEHARIGGAALTMSNTV